MAFKEIELDVCNGLNGILDIKDKKPTIKQNTYVDVSYRGLLIELKVKTLLIQPTDRYVGTVVSLPADKEKYDGLNVGDEIFFKEENICSIS